MSDILTKTCNIRWYVNPDGSTLLQQMSVRDSGEEVWEDIPVEYAPGHCVSVPRKWYECWLPRKREWVEE